MKHTRRGIMTCAAAALLAGLTGLAEAATIYVTPDGTGAGTPSWAEATSLTNALVIATASDQIWLAQGTYTNDATFTVPADRAIYGGFTNGMETLAERNWTNYPVLLDGQAANRRVVTVTAGVGATVLLDGLVVTNGGSGASAGGGIIKTGAGHLILANCRIVSNRGAGGGGRFEGGSILMTNSVVANNDGTTGSTSVHGYGIYVTATGITLDIVDCVFSGQYAANN